MTKTDADECTPERQGQIDERTESGVGPVTAAEPTPGASDDIARALAHLRASDPTLARLIDAAGAYELRRGSAHFSSLLSSIVSQQISTHAAAAVMRRVEALVPEGEELTAGVVVALDPGALRGAGLSAAKTAYVLDLAARVAGGQLDLERLTALDDEAVIAELVQVKGIGRWTAEMFLMFSLGRPDVLPVDDLGLRTALRRHYALATLPDRAASHALGAPWAPYRSVATWYLWRSLQTMPKER